MALTQIADDVWSDEGPVSPGPLFRMNTRMTAVRLPSGGVLLHSPIALDSAQEAEVAALGSVEHLVAPNLFHHFFLSAAKRCWPDATTWAPEGLGDKVRDLDIDEILTPEKSWLDCLDVLAIAGMPKFAEHAFFHQPSGTLLCTDLVFNHPKGHNALTRLFFRLAGTHDKLAVSKLFKSMIKDRPAFEESLGPILDLPIERVVMAHGDVLEDDAKRRFQQTLSK